MKETTYAGIVKGFKAKPTKAHRPAMWENMLGTVYARNAEGVTEYFDYDYDKAVAHAGIDVAEDVRIWREKERRAIWDMPDKGKLVVYVK